HAGGDEERDHGAAPATDEVADSHEEGREPGQQNGGTQVVHGRFLGRNLEGNGFAPKLGSALRLKCWVGRGRLPEALRRATWQALILLRRGASRGNGRCKPDARPPRVGGENAPFARGAAPPRGGRRPPRRTRPRGGATAAGAGVRRPQRRPRP